MAYIYLYIYIYSESLPALWTFTSHLANYTEKWKVTQHLTTEFTKIIYILLKLFSQNVNIASTISTSYCLIILPKMCNVMDYISNKKMCNVIWNQ